MRFLPVALPLTLLAAACPADAAQLPAPRQVDIPASASLTLHAQLYKPDGDGPFPTVIALHGCGGLGGHPEPVLPDLWTLGPELDPARSLAVFVDRTTVALPGHLADRASGLALVGSPGGGLRRDGDDLAGAHTTLPLTPRPGGLFQAQSRRFPHLRAYRAFSGQVLVAGRDDEGRLTVLTGVQLPGVLDDLYAEAAEADLGLVLDDDERPVLSVWAPTARNVELELSRAPGDEPKGLPMERDPVSGVSATAVLPADRSGSGP